jgi:hypothetical protein
VALSIIVDLERRQQHTLSSKDEKVIEDPNFDRKLDAITAGALPHVKQHLLTKNN